MPSHMPNSGYFAYASVFYEGAGKLLSNTLWWVASGPAPSGFDPNVLATDLYNNFKTELSACQSHNVSQIGLKVVHHEGVLSRTGFVYANTPGTDSSQAIPDESAVVVQRISDQPGRSGRGRLYIRGIPVAIISENRLSSGGNTVFAALVAKLKTAVTSQTIVYSPALLRRTDTTLHAAAIWTYDENLGTSRKSRVRF